MIINCVLEEFEDYHKGMLKFFKALREHKPDLTPGEMVLESYIAYPYNLGKFEYKIRA